MSKNSRRLGLCPDPVSAVYSVPRDPLAEFKVKGKKKKNREETKKG